MCKIGDIILVNSYKNEGVTIGKHSFVVISDEGGIIQGYSYDFIANVLSSFKSEEQKKKKLSYAENYLVNHNDTITNPHNKKDGFAKVDQLYFFNKDKLSYKVIGYMKEDVFEEMMNYILELDKEFKTITENLK